jgi:hypothetical protein
LARSYAFKATGAFGRFNNQSVLMPKEINFRYYVLLALFNAFPAGTARPRVELYEIR